VGLVTGGCLAAIGHRVFCVDRDPKRFRLLEEGRLPVYESHLTELIQRNRAAGMLTFTNDAAALRTADAIFLCIGVPQLENGESDFAALDSAANHIARSVDAPKLIVERSTVPVKTGEQLKHLLSVTTPNPHARFRVAANPQFLREGTAVEDFFHPERILLGVDDAESEAALRQIYAPILQQAFRCPIHPSSCPTHAPPELLLTSVRSAELIKQSSNAFLGIKISYANVLADLCERLGANVQEVTHAVGLDPRIRGAFFQAGIGFGGDRLPKDLRALCKLVELEGVDAGILQAAEDVNAGRVDAFFQKVQRSLSLCWASPTKQVPTTSAVRQPSNFTSAWQPPALVSQPSIRKPWRTPVAPILNSFLAATPTTQPSALTRCSSSQNGMNFAFSTGSACATPWPAH